MRLVRQQVASHMHLELQQEACHKRLVLLGQVAFANQAASQGADHNRRVATVVATVAA